MADTATITPRPTRRAASHVQPRRPAPERVGPAGNVGENERWLSALGGAAITLFGLSRESLGGLCLAALGGALMYRGVTGKCHLYESLGVNTAVPRGERTSVRAERGIKVEKSVTIARPAAELYRFWRNFENLPTVMRHLKSVTRTGGNRSHWVAEGPMGFSVGWDAEVITEKPNELIGWRSLEGSTVASAGSVHFLPAPGGRGTEVKVVLKYDPPAGQVGALIARLFGRDAAGEIDEDLDRFKAMMEAGETPTTAGQPRATCC